MDDCDVWFHNTTSFTKWCQCPQCQLELKDPQEASQSWLDKDTL